LAVVDRLAAILLIPLTLASALAMGGRSAPIGRQSPQPQYVGNGACGSCHKAISDSYAQTAMARTSGPAAPNLIEGSFQHSPSGVSFRLFRQGRTARLAYDRSAGPPLHGAETLKYFVGSNTRGRTFLFEIDGFLYQSPVNYFAAKRVWDMSPGYSQLTQMELNHPVDSTCLFCHSSRVQRPIDGTINRFAAEAFLQPGVGCERCHGPGSEHVAGRGSMVNPARLGSGRRDDVCMQCHLEGIARIARAGRREEDYRPGDMLSDVLAIFVREDAARGGLGAVSQFEALARSACKRGSGDALGCITCHDPHVRVAPADKAAFYRSRCLTCHATMANRHHAGQPDCTTCHMPRLDSADINHTAVTDHRIVEAKRRDRSVESPARTVTQFNATSPEPRDLGLAYGEVALRGDTFAAREAFRLLTQALHDGKDDADVLTRLGYLYLVQGDLEQAERLYTGALERDPNRGVVAADLGVLYARRGMLSRALELWRAAFENNPQLTDLGLDLGKGLCDAGDTSGARRVVERALRHNPDSASARQLLATLADSVCARPDRPRS
jgi:Flp pilus assembly protein TadD